MPAFTRLQLPVINAADKVPTQGAPVVPRVNPESPLLDLTRYRFPLSIPTPIDETPREEEESPYPPPAPTNTPSPTPTNTSSSAVSGGGILLAIVRMVRLTRANATASAERHLAPGGDLPADSLPRRRAWLVG